jgi:hypothetical protein
MSPVTFLACWVTQFPWGGCDTGNPESSAPELDEEKDVKTMKQHRVDAEEIGRHDVRWLGADELSPRGARSAWCRA